MRDIEKVKKGNFNDEISLESGIILPKKPREAFR